MGMDGRIQANQAWSILLLAMDKRSLGAPTLPIGRESIITSKTMLSLMKFTKQMLCIWKKQKMGSWRARSRGSTNMGDQLCMKMLKMVTSSAVLAMKVMTQLLIWRLSKRESTSRSWQRSESSKRRKMRKKRPWKKRKKRSRSRSKSSWMNKINARHNKRKKEKSTSVKCRRPKSCMRDKCKNLRHSKNY